MAQVADLAQKETTLRLGRTHFRPRAKTWAGIVVVAVAILGGAAFEQRLSPSDIGAELRSARLAEAGDEAATAPEVTQDVDAYVYYCHDGDTCRVAVAQGVWFNVRLAAIDAPELKKGGRGGRWDTQPGGEAARAETNRLLKGKTVRLRQVDLDPYNRPVAEFRDGSELVNLKLVEEGYAEAYRGKTKRLDKSGYFAAEARAKLGHKGIWALAGYESPSDYRKRYRE